jgi:REP element-mobilizing transposase RayT
VDEIAAAAQPPLRLGSCLLADPVVGKLVEDALQHFHGTRYDLAAWCVMPNLVQLVVTPFSPHSPSDVLHSWKSYTAHGINKLLGRTGPLWERESFDHLIRTLDDFERFVAYVENNPVVAGLCARPEDWQWSSARLRLL